VKDVSAVTVSLWHFERSPLITNAEYLLNVFASRFNTLPETPKYPLLKHVPSPDEIENEVSPTSVSWIIFPLKSYFVNENKE
jgi:hypothetical protein